MSDFMPQMPEGWPFNRNWSDEQLSALKVRGTKQWAELWSDSTEKAPVLEFTCDTCASRRQCDLAYDTYNTRGDCLAEK